MHRLLAPLLLVLAACASSQSFVLRAEADGRGAIATNLDTTVIAAEGRFEAGIYDATMDFRLTQPLLAVESAIRVRNRTAGFDETFPLTPGEPIVLPLVTEPWVRLVFTEPTVAAWGITFGPSE